MKAMRSGLPDMVRWLKDTSVDVKHEDGPGTTAAHLAAELPTEENITMLEMARYGNSKYALSSSVPQTAARIHCVAVSKAGSYPQATRFRTARFSYRPKSNPGMAVFLA
ncbi:hypothetical protein GB937_006182 [Aspergillus fischeri]|nr:hypothetical protein GB937_006182 [Aspergillus fischeri]